jgi:hypothetical protein
VAEVRGGERGDRLIGAVTTGEGVKVRVLICQERGRGWPGTSVTLPVVEGCGTVGDWR